jgi:hypothetical protein
MVERIVPLIEIPETHRHGFLMVENDQVVRDMNLLDCDFGIQVAEDGKVWICINGVAWLRFKPTVRRGVCSLCTKVVVLPYETPIDPPLFKGGRHCEECERWLQGRREKSDI